MKRDFVVYKVTYLVEGEPFETSMNVGTSYGISDAIDMLVERLSEENGEEVGEGVDVIITDVERLATAEVVGE